jgi:hypothetical protein
METRQSNIRLQPKLDEWVRDGIEQEKKNNPKPRFNNFSDAYRMAMAEWCEKYFPNLKEKYFPKK